MRILAASRSGTRTRAALDSGLTRAILLGVFILAVPLVAYGWLALSPGLNPDFVLPVEHFVAVTIISGMAVFVSLLIARSAVKIEQYQVLLISIGFMVVAGFFTVHALATPGVAIGGPASVSGAIGPSGSDSMYGSYATDYQVHNYDYSGTVIGVSGFLSVFVPSFLFAAAYTPLVTGLKRRVPIQLGVVLFAVVVGLLFYGFLAFWQEDLVARMPFSRSPYSVLVTLVAIVLLAFAAWHQWQIYAQTRFPMHGALVLSFLLLGEAELGMVVTRFWSAAWWVYHIVMFSATALALGALIIELDRRRGLERFLPAELVDRVVAGQHIRPEGERRVVTVLFADLRDSTSMAEHRDPENVIKIINTYVSAMARCVFAERGMLDKFTGDGLMAIFGIVPDGAQGAQSAVRAALAMQTAISDINRERSARGEVSLGFGIGIHTGEVVLGEVGLPQRSDFTAIGDTVNIAARLEELARDYRVEVVLSAEVAERLANDAPLRNLGETLVRGKHEPLKLLTLAANA